MMLSWLLTEVVPYSFYACALVALRYTLFYVLYPTGASSEARRSRRASPPRTCTPSAAVRSSSSGDREPQCPTATARTRPPTPTSSKNPRCSGGGPVGRLPFELDLPPAFAFVCGVARNTLGSFAVLFYLLAPFSPLDSFYDAPPFTAAWTCTPDSSGTSPRRISCTSNANTPSRTSTRPSSTPSPHSSACPPKTPSNPPLTLQLVQVLLARRALKPSPGYPACALDQLRAAATSAIATPAVRLRAATAWARAVSVLGAAAILALLLNYVFTEYRAVTPSVTVLGEMPEH
ncbi:uncharacterized protein BXZ73DRAFT_77988 [Epithele typhae]|uniref:uncharacterized protein n=1 Tax=Epithele typhae TaxID=378194 RepID=UPI0020089189|nr:uncharacterized protein BXZ73DRAFT_77988 [Epithele typhae]KAH9929868.1 hypothetical protein BXZ73DRAFT_77988 [Epithele typhae]